jgi:hypothetical protein
LSASASTCRFSRLGSIKEFLEGFKVPEPNKQYPIPTCLDDAEGVLQGAHDLLHVCMGQIVDYKVWPSGFQMGAILAYHDRHGSPSGRSKLLELVGMQLSLAGDLLHQDRSDPHVAWSSCFPCSMECFHHRGILPFPAVHQEWQRSGSGGYSKGDIVVTYILLVGALFLEAASLFRAATSTWTCAWLQRSTGRFKWIHAMSVYLRRGATAQRSRRWSSSIGQHDMSRFHGESQAGACSWILSQVGLEEHWNRLRFSDSIVI